MKNPSDIKIVNIISNINRGLDYWETRIDFYDIDTGEYMSRVYTYEKELSPRELAEFIEQKRSEIVTEVEMRQNMPEPPNFAPPMEQ